MTGVLTALGVVIILLGLRDMFHQLLHPPGRGRISRLVFGSLWRLSRAAGHRFGLTVGPASMVAVILMWVVLQGAGWALVYLPHVPEGFDFADGPAPGDHPAVLDALYISLVSLSTLGFGDVVATEPLLRILPPLQALTGFALLTAALTWFIEVQPPLAKREAVAFRLYRPHAANYAEHIDAVEEPVAAQVLDGLSEQLTAVSLDLSHHSETYYFHEDEAQLSLAGQLPYALSLRDAASASSSAAVRLGAVQLSAALDELASALASRHSDDKDVRTVFDAYAADHRRRPR